MTTPENVPSLVRPLDFANILDWYERSSANPLATPFYSDDTPGELAESFCDSFGLEAPR